MTREIKFRFWDKQNKKMHNNLVLGNMSNDVQFNIFNQTWIPMQFTGFHDKNEKEIYEGDIVKLPTDSIDDKLCIIEWQQYNTRFILKRWARKLDEICCYEIDDDMPIYVVEVIGNIYENPELLETNKVMIK